MKTKILIIIVVSNIFFIAGLLTGYYLYPRINYGSFDSSDVCINTTHCNEVYLTANEAKAFLEEVRETLREKNVTFAQIIDLKTKYDKHSFEYLQQDQDSSVYKKLKDYVDLVEAILTNDIAEARIIANRPSILISHAKLVRKLKKGQDYSELKSFVDIQKTVKTPQPVAGEPVKNKPVESKWKFTCDKCGPYMYFSSPKDLDAHIRNKHSER